MRYISLIVTSAVLVFSAISLILLSQQGPLLSYEALMEPQFNLAMHSSQVSIELLDEQQAETQKMACNPLQRLILPVRVTNDSIYMFRSTLEPGARGVNIAYQIHKDKAMIFESSRFLLGGKLAAGQADEVVVEVACPSESGVYDLVIDLVQEAVVWNHMVTGWPNYIKVTLDVADI